MWTDRQQNIISRFWRGWSSQREGCIDSQLSSYRPLGHFSELAHLSYNIESSHVDLRQIQGAFIYSPLGNDNEAVENPKTTGKRQHVFFSTSTILHVSPGSDYAPSRFPFRRRRPSVSGPDSNVTPTERSFPFSFELPGSSRVGEQLPPSFTEFLEPESSIKLFDVVYKISLVWEAHNHADHPRT